MAIGGFVGDVCGALIKAGTKDMLDMYHSCIEKVKEDAKTAWFFPKTDSIACLGHLTNAIEPTTQALYEVANSKWKGGNVPTFLMAATVVISLCWEYYAAMVFQENWKRWSGAEPPQNASEAMNVTYTFCFEGDHALKWSQNKLFFYLLSQTISQIFSSHHVWSAL